MYFETSQIASFILKLILISICLYYIATRIIRYRKNERGQTLFKLTITIIIWGGILIVTLTPSLALSISTTLGLGENLNTLIFLGFVFSFALNFRLLRSIEALESNFTELVSKIAVSNVKKVGEEKKSKEFTG